MGVARQKRWDSKLEANWVFVNEEVEVSTFWRPAAPVAPHSTVLLNRWERFKTPWLSRKRVGLK
jgi:hypothetical protein